jgi:putative flippase GtrA
VTAPCTPAEAARGLGLRWLKFNLVGVIGFVVQLAALALFRSGWRMELGLATALAVELAVLHNFVWHELYTWRDRTRRTRGVLGRLVRFNLTTGAVSIIGNVVITKLLVGQFGLNYLAANVLAIIACSLATFAASHWLVFKRQERP